MSDVNLQPMNDRLIVARVASEETTSFGLVLPDSAKEKPQLGKVLAVGPGKLNRDGGRIPMTVKVGDTVMFTKYGPTEVKHEGKELLFVDEDSILAIVQ